jgi:hypothetical protein
MQTACINGKSEKLPISHGVRVVSEWTTNKKKTIDLWLWHTRQFYNAGNSASFSNFYFLFPFMLCYVMLCYILHPVMLCYFLYPASVIQSRTFRLPVCYLETQKWEYTELEFLPVVLYGCETWSLILREEHRLRMYENRVLRIFKPKGDEVTGGWRKLHDEELHNLYSSPSIIRMIKSRRMRWTGHVSRMYLYPSRSLFGRLFFLLWYIFSELLFGSLQKRMSNFWKYWLPLSGFNCSCNMETNVR